MIRQLVFVVVEYLYGTIKIKVSMRQGHTETNGFC